MRVVSNSKSSVSNLCQGEDFILKHYRTALNAENGGALNNRFEVFKRNTYFYFCDSINFSSKRMNCQDLLSQIRTFFAIVLFSLMMITNLNPETGLRYQMISLIS